MMFASKEEVEAQGQKFNEPSAGIPIKKRPFNLNGPLSLQSDSNSLDKLSHTPNCTPKSLFDFASSSPCFSNNSNNNNPTIGKSPNNLGLEIAQDAIAPELQSSTPSGAVKHEKTNNCSTDLSLTGNCSSKVQNNNNNNNNHESLNCSGRRAALDLNVDLNVPIETWDSTSDFAIDNNRREAVQPLVKQQASGGMNMGFSGNFRNRDANNKSGLEDVTLDLQLKLPPRPELRMKNYDPICSSDLSLSLSGKDLDYNNNNNNNNTPKSSYVQSPVVEPSKETSASNSVNVVVKPVSQKEVNVIVKKEVVHDGNLKEKAVQETGTKDLSNLPAVNLVKNEPIESQHLGEKISEKSSNNGIDLNQTASSSNPAVTTPVPVTSVPNKSVPASLVPNKSVPVTLVPNKSVPVSLVPSKSVPVSLVPSKSVPVNLDPKKGVPVSLVPSKSVPVSLVPSKSVPVSLVPSKSVPVNLVPSNCVPVGGSAIQPAITKASTNVLPGGGLVAQSAITKSSTSLPVGSVVPKSNQSLNNDNTSVSTNVVGQSASSLVPTCLPSAGNSSHLAGIMEDVKPVISSVPVPVPVPVPVVSSVSLPVPAVVNIVKQTVPMASEGASQGSADMDCSEGGNQYLSKLATIGKSKEDISVNLQESCSSKIPKPEPGIENIGKDTGNNNDNNNNILGGGEIPKSPIPLTVPNLGHNNENYDKNVLGGDENEIMASKCTTAHLRPMNILALSNKTKQSLEMDRLGSKSRSPSVSNKRDSSNSRQNKETESERENFAEREIGSSSRHFVVGEGSNNNNNSNCQFQRRFKRSGLGFDRPDFGRKKSRVCHWDDASNNRSNRNQRWDTRRFNEFDNEDQNGETGHRPVSNNRNRPNFHFKNNRFNNNRNNKSRGSGGNFKFTRQHNNNNTNNNDSDMPFHEGRPGPRPCLSRFQTRRRLADVSPRELDEMDPPVFDHHYNNNKRGVEHAVMCSRDRRSFSPVPRRGTRHWTPPVDMISNEVLTRARSPVHGRRPYYNKDCANRRHMNGNNNNNNNNNNNRPLQHRNNSRRYVGPALEQHFDGPVHHFEGDAVLHFHQVRYCSEDDDNSNNGPFTDAGAPSGRPRNRVNNNNNSNSNNNSNGVRRQGGDQDEYRYYNTRGGPHGWRDINNNNNNANNNNNSNNNNSGGGGGDKLKRRRYD